HHTLVALRPDPALVPIAQAGDRGALGAVLAIALAERDLLGRPFRNGFLRIGEMRMIVVADRAHGETARTIAERADDAKEPLPEAEHLARARHLGFFGARRIDEALEELQYGGKSELLRLGGTGALVDAEMQHRIGRAGMQAAATGFADAHLLGDRPVRLERKLGEDAGEIHARAEFRRQDIDLETERAEPGLDAEMTGREAAVARALVVPVGFLRGGDEGR